MCKLEVLSFKLIFSFSFFILLASIAQTAHINIENGNQNQNLEKNYRKENDAMDNLGDAVDALVKAAKIAIDQSADEIDSKINDAIERLQDISSLCTFYNPKLQSQTLTMNFLTMNFSTMNFSTMNFSTMNFSTMNFSS